MGSHSATKMSPLCSKIASCGVMNFPAVNWGRDWLRLGRIWGSGMTAKVLWE